MSFYYTAQLLRAKGYFICMMIYALCYSVVVEDCLPFTPFLQEASHFKQKYLLDFSGLGLNLFWNFYSKLREMWVAAVTDAFIFIFLSLNCSHWSDSLVSHWNKCKHIRVSPVIEHVSFSVREKRCWRAESCCSNWCRTVSPCCPTRWSPRAQRRAEDQVKQPQQQLVHPRPVVQSLCLNLRGLSGNSTLTCASVRTGSNTNSTTCMVEWSHTVKQLPVQRTFKFVFVLAPLWTKVSVFR